jgi:hypothetical protein
MGKVRITDVFIVTREIDDDLYPDMSPDQIVDYEQRKHLGDAIEDLLVTTNGDDQDALHWVRKVTHVDG